MSKHQTDCNPDLTKRFLNKGMNDLEQRAFESHLDQCVSCQQQLTEATASDSWWNETREFLTDDADAPEVSETLSFLNPTDNPRMMGRFGGYEIAGIIGQGGMGVVLKGFDNSLNRYAAIKVLAPQLATRGSARNRFAREAQAAAAVVHDNVIAIHGVSEASGLPYLVMPYIRGESLQTRIDRDGAMTPTEIVRIAHQIASGLAAAHAQGLVHRDIKPANILLPEGIQRVLITDFGLARAVDDSNLTGTGTIAGTPQFMSPEQARGETVDPRSDLFSLGTVMYAMCTGRNPFRAENPYGVLRRIIEDRPRPIREINAEIPPWLQTIVETLHSKSLEDRYQSAAHLAELLEKCLAHLQNPLISLPSELKNPPNDSNRRSFKLATGALIVAIALGGWGFTSGMFSTQQNPQTEKTEQDLAGNSDSQQEESESKVRTDAELAAEIERRKEQSGKEQRQRDDENRREQLLVMSNQIMSLHRERNFLGAKQVERKVLELLRDGDRDHDRINELRKTMIQLRLDGKHQSADELTREIAEIQQTMENRYKEIDRIDALLEKSGRKLRTMRKKYEALLRAERHDEAEDALLQIVKYERELEIDYLSSHANPLDQRLSAESDRDESIPVDPLPETEAGNLAAYERLVEVENELIDATASLQSARAKQASAEETLEHSKKLLAKGYITKRQQEADALALDNAKLLVVKCEANMKLAERKMDALRPRLPESPGDDKTDVVSQEVVDYLRQVLEYQIAVESQQYGPDHPKIKALKTQFEYWQQYSAKKDETKN